MPTNQLEIVVKTVWYAGIAFKSEVSSVSYEDDVLTIQQRSGQSSTRIQTSDLDSVAITEGTFSSEILILARNGQTWTCQGMRTSPANDLAKVVGGRIEHHRTEEARPIAQQVAPQIAAIGALVGRWLTDDSKYRRKSEADPMVASIRGLVDQCDKYVQKHFDAEAAEVFKNLVALNTGDAMEKARHDANERYVIAAKPVAQTSARDLVPLGLTDEQARAVVTGEDTTLVLAGAGSGKTLVIAAKVAHLVRDLKINPESILVMAYNNAAAAEIRRRLPADLSGVVVRTFHALARDVISDLHGAPSITRLAEDTVRYNQTIDQLLEQVAQDEAVADAILFLSASLPQAPVYPFDFTSEAEYVQYARRQEHRTLGNIKVKSFQEVLIANFLTQHSVDFRYEAPYPHNTSRERRQYQPDFYLPDHDIYIEQFALDQNGNPPPGWSDYKEGVEWKRALHRRHGTTLIETYSWQDQAGTLLTGLAETLTSRGVNLVRLPTPQLLEYLNEEHFSRLSRLIGQFMQHYRSDTASQSSIVERVAVNPYPRRAEQFLTVLQAVEKLYRDLLKNEQAVDFDDLINGAADALEGGAWAGRFLHILVDEFQDISAGRMRLLKALKGSDTAMFLVGDDWQSIYRFAGSRVDLMQHCDRHLGYTQRVELGQTFRFGAGILETSSAFVRRNPSQSQREMRSEDTDEGVTIVIERDQREALDYAQRSIMEYGDSNDTVLMLGRYRYSRGGGGTMRGMPNASFSTVHRAKGREADHVVILDVNGGRFGFPNTIEDDPIMEMVIPPQPEDDEVEHAEERRLFYVALTRAKKSAFVVTSPYNPSPFVEELIELDPNVRRVGELMPRCPACGEGVLVPSKSGDNLRCSKWSECKHLSPRCRFCKVGYAIITPHEVRVKATAVCSNPGCEREATVCSRCRRGVMRVVTRSHGRYLGCSRFFDEPPCSHRERMR